MKKERFAKTVNIRNKRASFDFEFVDKYVCGMALKGTEIKSIREGKVNLQDGFCYFHEGELYAKGISIMPYSEGTYYNHDATRERKLLLKRAELKKLEKGIESKGMTVIPVRLFINDRGLAKLEIALGKGKKQFDKRQSIKEKDVKRELSRVKFS